MKKVLVLIVFAISVKNAFAWGKEGHEIVAQFAFDQLSDKAKENVKRYLADISIARAGTWMDEVRSDKTYDFTKSWHYINISKGLNYAATTDENVVNEILIAERELSHKETLCPEQIKFDLLVLFHLIGDIHQPLHVGYGEDKGGNEIQITFDGKKTNLHSLLDSKLIEDQHITLSTIEKEYKLLPQDVIAHERTTSVEDWVKTSRMYLPLIYNFSDGTITSEYVKQNKEIIIAQLINAGIDLAAILEKIFGEPVQQITTKNPNDGPIVEISPEMASDYVGKDVVVCGKVYGVKESAKVNFLNMGAAFPNSPFTVVIFSADKENMKIKLSKFNGKTICVKGTVVEYNGKAEIIVKSESQIEIKQ
jgi:hypothetical protein